MAGVVLRRVVLAVPVLLLVTLIVYSLQELTPGDPAQIVAGDGAAPQLVDQIRHQLGLDQPFPIRYLAYLGNALTGDLGSSLQTRQPVIELIGAAIPVSISLAVVALVLTVLIALPLGFVSAARRGGWIDRVIVGGSAVSLAVPPFVVGLLLQVFVGVQLRLLPSTGYVSLGEDPAGWLLSLLLPGLTIAVASAAELARQVRGSLVETFEQDFVRTARARGLPERVVLLRHCAKNSAVAVLTVFGLLVSRVLSGAVLVETIFALPGLGALGVNSVISKDYPVIEGVVIFSGLVVVVSNLVVDVVNTYLSPRSAVSLR